MHIITCFISVFALNFYHVHYLTYENNDRLKKDFDNIFWCSTLQWLYNGRDGVSNHHCILNSLFRRRSKELPAQMASNAENVSIRWRHHEASWLWCVTRNKTSYLIRLLPDEYHPILLSCSSWTTSSWWNIICTHVIFAEYVEAIKLFAVFWFGLVSQWRSYVRHAHDTLQWRHNERGGVSNHQRIDCLRNRLFRRRSKKTLKRHGPLWREVTGDRWIPRTKGQ